MKNNFWVVIFLIVIIVGGCKKESEIAHKNNGWEEKTFFSNVESPKVNIDRFNQDYNHDGKENYSVVVNEFSYRDFYNYIMDLEKDGFHYEFVNEYVPKDISKLSDKTETSWSATKDNIYIIATWRSNDNIYYNGYNLHLLFYNYDYTDIEDN